ncbi:MAG: response regulator transcription factor [Clostridiales bacterium]|nr:response regulator transcription factor [Clostridiales bacterium]
MKLLVAEDEQSLSRALVTILERSGYRADAVANGEEALERLESGDYDGVILDVMMPKMDGITALKKIRERGNPIPVLLLTAKAEVDDKVEGLDSGANDYLTKPFATKELLARIRAMTRMHAGMMETNLTMGNVSLNRASFELSTPSGSLRLSNREFQVIEFLICNPGHPITAERIFEKIWRGEDETPADVVLVYISYLKKKLTALHADIVIRTVAENEYSLEVAL